MVLSIGQIRMLIIYTISKSNLAKLNASIFTNLNAGLMNKKIEKRESERDRSVHFGSFHDLLQS